MDHRQRFVRTLLGQEVDRVPFIKVFGGDNSVLPHWEKEHPGIGQDIDKIIGFDCPYRGWSVVPVNFDFSQRGEPEVTTRPNGEVLYRWEDGTVALSLPHGDFHYQTIEFPVKNREDWRRVRDKYMDPDDPARFPENWDACVKDLNARDFPLQLTHRGIYGMMRNLMGDELLCMMFYDDPELIHEMMGYCTDMMIRIWDKMTCNIEFDLVEFWEDMASKNGSLLSPATFREFMKPNYIKVAEYARDHDIKILLVDSDGYTDNLAELMSESGVNALYPFEVLAGCDVTATLNKLPKMAAIGGLDKNCMALGKPAIEAELEKARRLIKAGRYIPGPDHFVLSNVTFESYLYFMERLKEIVMTTKPGNV